jgi:hypothetical protein
MYKLLKESYIEKKTRNIFMYWIGKEYSLITLFRKIIYKHSNNGKNYKVHFITPANINQYVNIPPYFYQLKPAHQADFVRVNVICDYGGIWLDSDTLVMNSLDSLFNILEEKDGFFIKENNKVLLNGVFGSRKNTQLMIEWKNKVSEILNNNYQIEWTEIGSKLLMSIYDDNPNFYNNYKIFNGLDNMYPVNWMNVVQEFIDKPYDNYKNIIRHFQPVIILINSAYKKLENKTEIEILNSNIPLNYFINKSNK